MSDQTSREIYGAVMAHRASVARQLGGDGVDDVLHDAWLAAARAVESGRPIANLRAYARGIVRLGVIAEIRRRQAGRRIAPLDPRLRDRRPSPEQIAIEHERRDLAAEILGRLPVEFREAIVAYCQEPAPPATRRRKIQSIRRALDGRIGQTQIYLRVA